MLDIEMHIEKINTIHSRSSISRSFYFHPDGSHFFGTIVRRVSNRSGTKHYPAIVRVNTDTLAVVNIMEIYNA